MENTLAHKASDVPELQAIPAAERIEVLDVIRGFALIGIFFMNIEWFNRSFLDFSGGIPSDAKGLDWAAHYFVNFFVAGKFWTIFSLLFGMGFAVMLTRSEATGRAFIKPYLRRIAALAVFGILHINLLWQGDILYSYAYTAAGLLLILFGSWKWFVGLIIVFTGMAFIPNLGSIGMLAGMTAYMGLFALFIRNEKRYTLFGRAIPLFSLIGLVIGMIASCVAIASMFVPAMSEITTPAWIATAVGLSTGTVSAIFHQPVEARLWRAGVWMYVLPMSLGLVFGIIAYQEPVRSVFDSPAAIELADKKLAEKKADEAAEKLAEAKGEKWVKPEKKEDKKVEKTKAQKELESDAAAINRIRETRETKAKEVKLFSSASYSETFQHRTKEFLENPFNEASQAFMSICLFLIGVWFVRSKVIVNAKQHLPLFRRIAYIGLPIGLGLSVAASFITVSHERGVLGDGWHLVQSMIRLGSLPACMGYVSVLVLMVYSKSIFSKITILAPMGRMALTNYLMQSVVQASFFYGWGLGHFGMGRAQQLGFAIIVLALQLVFSHWWLARFQYGPMEWIWRGITYWQIPKLRIESKKMNPQLV